MVVHRQRAFLAQGLQFGLVELTGTRRTISCAVTCGSLRREVNAALVISATSPAEVSSPVSRSGGLGVGDHRPAWLGHHGDPPADRDTVAQRTRVSKTCPDDRAAVVGAQGGQRRGTRIQCVECGDRVADRSYLSFGRMRRCVDSPRWSL